MTPPAEPTPNQADQRRPLRRMILARTPALPVLTTLLNGVAGFASIHYATKAGMGSATLEHLSIAAWLIFAAMFFDALDGRLARLTRHATDFGAQMDSLCDAVSFGVAPAVLMIQVVAMALKEQIRPFDAFAPEGSLLGKAVMGVAVLYLCCAVLRLARFNIENAPDVLHHMGFKGLPSPAAAATVAATVLLFAYLYKADHGWQAAPWLSVATGATLPVLTLAGALLMVSRFPYPHLVNRFIVGRKPFNVIVIFMVLLIVGLMFRQLAVAVAAMLYALSGPAVALWRKVRPGRAAKAQT